MKSLALLTLLSITFLTFGQETKSIRNKGKNHYDIYEVLKKKKKIKHGLYEKYWNNDSLIMRGYYSNGEKTGIWEYFGYKGELKKKYDYDKYELIYFNSKADTVTDVIRENGQLIRVIIDLPPQYEGGDLKFRQFINESIEYPIEAVEMGIQGTVKICFYVTTEGIAVDHYIKESKDSYLDKEALRVVKLLPHPWIPAKVNGEPVEILITLPVVFKLG